MSAIFNRLKLGLAQAFVAAIAIGALPFLGITATSFDQTIAACCGFLMTFWYPRGSFDKVVEPRKFEIWYRPYRAAIALPRTTGIETLDEARKDVMETGGFDVWDIIQPDGSTYQPTRLEMRESMPPSPPRERDTLTRPWNRLAAKHRG